jgi:hypothetical protein
MYKGVYTNPEDFLWELAVMWSGVGMQSRKMIRKNDNNFAAEVLECNVDMYPGPNQQAYKEAYGVCTVRGCHRYVSEGLNVCPLHEDEDFTDTFARVLGFGADDPDVTINYVDIDANDDEDADDDSSWF